MRAQPRCHVHKFGRPRPCGRVSLDASTPVPSRRDQCEQLPRPGPLSVPPWSCPLSSSLNLGIVAHVDAGKTSLTERLLYDAGVVDAPGSVDAGTTRTDSMALERRRGITIRAAVTSFALGDLDVNLVDTPGPPRLHRRGRALPRRARRGGARPVVGRGRPAADRGDLARTAADRCAHRDVREQGRPRRRRRRPGRRADSSTADAARRRAGPRHRPGAPRRRRRRDRR